MTDRTLTAREYWEWHPRLQDDIFRFAEEYADYLVEEARGIWLDEVAAVKPEVSK